MDAPETKAVSATLASPTTRKARQVGAGAAGSGGAAGVGLDAAGRISTALLLADALASWPACLSQATKTSNKGQLWLSRVIPAAVKAAEAG
jgi:hypothetical protein